MRDNSWDNGGAARRGSRRPWLKWIFMGFGVAFGLPLLMTIAFGSLALRNRAKVWPVVRAIHARLQTDEGAKDLFAKNRVLSDMYASDQDFVDSVKAWRDKVGSLPVQEPQNGPTYSPNVDPDGFAASVQGSGGAWMTVTVRGGGAFAESTDGEGIIRISFGEDRKALRAARRKGAALRTRREWEDFRKVMLACGDDGTATALYRQEPGLRRKYPSETAFLEAMKALRPAIARLPGTLVDDSNSFGVRIHRTPFSNTRVLMFADSDGQELRATWSSGQLSDLELRRTDRPR